MSDSPDTRPGEPHWALRQEEQKTCPFCRTMLGPRAQVIVCPACRTPHHLECWIDNGRCTTYGCREVAAARPRRFLLRRVEETPLDIRLGPAPPAGQHFDMGLYRLVLWFCLISLIGTLALLWIHGFEMATMGLPFGVLFGVMSLAMAHGLFRYARSDPGQRMDTATRHHMRATAYLGIVIGTLQVALNVTVALLYLLSPS